MNIYEEWDKIHKELLLEDKEYLISARLIKMLIEHVYDIELWITKYQGAINEQKQTDGTSEKAE